MRCTSRVDGYEAVKMGSKIAARYKESIGDVWEDAIMEPGCGSRALCCLAKDLKERSQHRERLVVPWYGPFLHAINLKIDPPNPRYSKYKPQ